MGEVMDTVKSVGKALVGSGALDVAGGILTNLSNRGLAKEQMQFQERMRSTSHQTEVADLLAAGLNPVLSAGGRGADSPSGAMATMANPAEGLSNKILARQQAKNQAFISKAAINKSNSEVALNDSQSQVNAMNALKIAADTNVSEATKRKLEKEINKIVAEINLTKSKTNLSNQQYQILENQMQKLAKINQMYKVPGLSNILAFFKEVFGSVNVGKRLE